MKALSPNVRALIQDWADQNDGKVYAPVLHPEFADLPYSHGPERFSMIRPFLGHAGGTVLDIGSHWGYMAHRLEELGYTVTAVEHSDRLFPVLEGLRDACGKTFKTIHASIFDIEDIKYDIVLALNIFHHFLKKKNRYDQFLRFLDRLECQSMIFQPHRAEEPQMRDAYKNMGPAEFAGFVAKHARLGKVERIGEYGKRHLYKLSRS